ncbi:MAG: hypothetical protein ACK5LT_02325 [Lachnospirales bacterium]
MIGNYKCIINYKIYSDKVIINGEINKSSIFILPITSDKVLVRSHTGYSSTDDIFYHAGGFSAIEYYIKSDNFGKFTVEIDI